MRETAAKAREVVDGVVQVYLPLPMRPSIVNVYLVRAGATWTLIDTGMNTDESVAAFRGALAEVGIAPESIVRLVDRKSTRLNSSHVRISYAVFCLKQKKKRTV